MERSNETPKELTLCFCEMIKSRNIDIDVSRQTLEKILRHLLLHH